jgi:hypothetical protein
MNDATPNIRPGDLAKERAGDLIRTANTWLKDLPAGLTSAEQAARCQTFIEQVDAEIKRIAVEAQEQAAPHRTAINTIKLFYEPLSLALHHCKNLLAPMRKSWLDREQKRLETEQRAREAEATRLMQEATKLQDIATRRPTVESKIAAEQAAKAAATAVRAASVQAARAQLRGLYSTRAASVKILWRAELTDELQAYLYYQDNPAVGALLTKLGSAEAPAAHREKREIPGFRLVEKEVAA